MDSQLPRTEDFRTVKEEHKGGSEGIRLHRHRNILILITSCERFLSHQAHQFTKNNQFRPFFVIWIVLT
jgi:hypothetical protein